MHYTNFLTSYLKSHWWLITQFLYSHIYYIQLESLFLVYFIFRLVYQLLGILGAATPPNVILFELGALYNYVLYVGSNQHRLIGVRRNQKDLLFYRPVHTK